jgi:hypothetical protein
MMRMADLLDGWRRHLKRCNLDQLRALMVVHEFLILSRKSKMAEPPRSRSFSIQEEFSASSAVNRL